MRVLFGEKDTREGNNTTQIGWRAYNDVSLCRSSPSSRAPPKYSSEGHASWKHYFCILDLMLFTDPGLPRHFGGVSHDLKRSQRVESNQLFLETEQVDYCPGVLAGWFWYILIVLSLCKSIFFFFLKNENILPQFKHLRATSEPVVRTFTRMLWRHTHWTGDSMPYCCRLKGPCLKKKPILSIVFFFWI